MSRDNNFIKVTYVAHSAGGPPWTYYINQNIGKYFTYVFWKLHVSPNTVTILGALVEIAANALLVWRVKDLNIWWIIAIGIMWQIGYSLDCSDGQLARLTGKGSKFGVWFDLMIDFVNHSLLVSAIFFLILVNRGTSLTISEYWLYFASFAFCLSANLFVLFSSNIKKLIFGKERKILPYGAFNGVEIVRNIIASILDYGTFLFLMAIFLKIPALLFYVINGYSFLGAAAVLGTGIMFYKHGGE